MNVLVLNPGSSSLKYRQLKMPEEAILADGEAEHSGGDDTAAAAAGILPHLSDSVDALGFRVVHGGARYVTATPINDSVIDGIRDLSAFAPLHNPVAVSVIEAYRRLLPDCPGVAVFDTAFHAGLPAQASHYALPLALTEQYGLRRYGAHGISYSYISAYVREHLGREATQRLIICHLGNGASVCAVKDGASIDTSMGLTPLEGLVMGTRAGDVDPGLLVFLLQHAGMTSDDLNDLLNHKSGLLGLSGLSADVRDLEAAAQAGDKNAALALDVFAYRVRKYIGAYTAALEGLDVLVFTGGIGEHSADIRARVCCGLAFLGISLADDANKNAAKKSARIDDGRAQVWMIPADEEVQIARETFAVLQR